MITLRPKIILDHLFFAILAFFLNAGSIKADPRVQAALPVDLTFYCSAALALLLLPSLLQDRDRVAGSQILWSLGFLGLVIPGIILAPSQAYAAEKSLYLATLTLLAFMAGLDAGHRPEGLTRMIGWLMAFSLLVTGDALVHVITTRASLDRVSGFSGTTIVLGRAAGLVFLVEAARFLLWPKGVMRQVINMAIAVPAAVVVLFSGSKGPLLSAVLVLMILLLLSDRKASPLRMVVLGCFAALGLASAWSLTPVGSMGRLSTFFAGNYGDSETTRWLAIKKALPLIATHPWGIGWGGFFGQVPQWAHEGRQYAHNLVVELFMEGGWIPGAGFVFIFVRSWHRVCEHAHREERGLWIGLVLYTLFNALVSGDVNDSRLFFVLLGYGLGRQVLWGPLEPPQVDLREFTNHRSRRGLCESSI